MTTFTDKELIKEIKERIGSLDVRDNIERRAYEIALASLAAVSDERAAYELFMEKRFGESVDRRRAKNGDREYMAWDMALGWIIWCHRAAMLQGSQPVSQTYQLNELSGNSPVTQDGWVMVPKKLTAENGAKGVLSGEFSETTFISCPECFGDDDCDTCDGSGRIEIKVPVTWSTIKSIWDKGIEYFAAKPSQEVK
ncbi:molecular chaperone DnaJ [Escherichia coli]|nr:molecular chaperone DnaJ [Escherichia coli]EKL2826371.1 molecular chaperone DnaJ [Escherichia coli]